MGRSQNGELLTLAEAEFDIFLTADKNIRYQQSLKGRKIALIEFPTNKLSLVKRLESELKAKLNQISSGDYIILETSELY